MSNSAWRRQAGSIWHHLLVKMLDEEEQSNGCPEHLKSWFGTLRTGNLSRSTVQRRLELVKSLIEHRADLESRMWKCLHYHCSHEAPESHSSQEDLDCQSYTVLEIPQRILPEELFREVRAMLQEKILSLEDVKRSGRQDCSVFKTMTTDSLNMTTLSSSDTSVSLRRRVVLLHLIQVMDTTMSFPKQDPPYFPKPTRLYDRPRDVIMNGAPASVSLKHTLP